MRPILRMSILLLCGATTQPVDLSRPVRTHEELWRKIAAYNHGWRPPKPPPSWPRITVDPHVVMPGPEDLYWIHWNERNSGAPSTTIRHVQPWRPATRPAFQWGGPSVARRELILGPRPPIHEGRKPWKWLVVPDDDPPLKPHLPRGAQDS